MDFQEVIDTTDYCDSKEPGNISNCHGAQRIAVILSCYKDWAEHTTHNKEESPNNDEPEPIEPDGFYCFMHEALNYASDANSCFTKLLNDYNHLLFHHNDTDSFETLYNFFNSNIYENTGCTLDNCKMLSRNNRDRSKITTHEYIRTELYHGFESSKEICIQQTVDRIHCQYLHCYDMGYKLTRKERDLIINDIKIEEDVDDLGDQEEEDQLLHTMRLRKISSILAPRRNRDSRNRNRRNDKFTTIIIDKKKSSLANILNQELDAKEIEFSDDNDDDDDGKCDNNNSQILMQSSTLHKDVKLRQGLREEDGPDGDEYSFSYRYFYWQAYISLKKDNDFLSKKSKSILGDIDDDIVEIEPGNKGYKIYDWYVQKRYKDLKTEITQNIICTIGIQQFEDCVTKAEKFMECEEIGKKLKSYGEWIYKYDIVDDEPIKLDHIVSLLLYCNYDLLQGKFSGTFRRDIGETDEQMRKRHGEFANWGRILREAVELYGDNIGGQYTDENGNIQINQSIKRLKFYHGISCELLFPKTIARFNGPTSTTITISVAMAFANTKGLCLQLIRKDPEYKHSSFFNCVPISDFTYEEERFFIGGLEPLQISTIIHTQTNTNYRSYIRALNNIQNFIEGTNNGWAIHKVSNKMTRHIREMFNNYSIEEYEYNNNENNKCKLPLYILNLFRSYANSVTKIDLYLEAINSEKSVQGKYGFKRIRELIMIKSKHNKERQWVKMDSIGNIFRKCKELHIRSGYSINMIKLDGDLMSDLVGFIQSNNVIERFQQLKIINIYQPQQGRMTLKKAMKDYEKKCAKHGWTLNIDQKNKILKLTRNEKNKLNKNKKENKSFLSKIKNVVNK